MLADGRYETEVKCYQVMGALFFEEDFFERIRLPKIHEHDKMLIMNTASNIKNTWSGYCDRIEPDFIFI